MQHVDADITEARLHVSVHSAPNRREPGGELAPVQPHPPCDGDHDATQLGVKGTHLLLVTSTESSVSMSWLLSTGCPRLLSTPCCLPNCAFFVKGQQV